MASRSAIGHRVRIASDEYLFGDRRTPAPPDGHRLSAAELSRLLELHGGEPSLRLALGARPTSAFARQRDGHRGMHGGRSGAQFPGLVVYRLPRQRTPTDAGERSGELAGAPAPPPDETPMFDETPHWLEVVLVGEDDEGVAGVPCEITLPTGQVLRRVTDRFGLVRVEGIASTEPCTVRFPTLDAEAWEPA